ncbi:MAG: hypothetical protein U0992_18135 [Planctomycetaceae bacterium]
MRTGFLLLHCWLSLIAIGLADEPKAVELALSPQTIETPILKYRLLPAESELKPGNAATILLKLPWDQQPYMERIYPKLGSWSERPLNAPEWADFEKEFILPDSFYDTMKRAAYRRDVDWAYPTDEESLWFILLPDVQGLRSFLGYGLTAKAKYHLSRGELDRAREVILVGLANSRHMSRAPILVSQVVGAVIDTMMLDQTAVLIAQPDSPNLYWALSTLPAEMFNTGRAAELEADQLSLNLPAIRDLDKPRDPSEWTRMADQLMEYLRFNDELPADADPDLAVEKERLRKLARIALPRLLNADANRMAGMSDDEAMIRWFVLARTALDHHAAAILGLKPPEAASQWRTLEANLQQFRSETGLRVGEGFRTRGSYVRLWTVNRKIQALRIVEAVRHHLASHDSKLPAQLSEISDLPIPLDPLSGRPFEWTVDRTANTATLKSPPIDSAFGDGSAAAIEYRLKVR